MINSAVNIRLKKSDLRKLRAPQLHRIQVEMADEYNEERMCFNLNISGSQKESD